MAATNDTKKNIDQKDDGEEKEVVRGSGRNGKSEDKEKNKGRKRRRRIENDAYKGGEKTITEKRKGKKKTGRRGIRKKGK